MRSLIAACVALSLSGPLWAAERAEPKFKKLTFSKEFVAEGSYFGDFNKDGKMDVVIGPYWYEGPTFQTKHEIRPPKTFDPKGYSDIFLTFTADFNGDGWTDIFHISFPGQAGHWYENPQGKPGHWKEREAFPVIDNESPMWGDVNGDGRPDLVFNTGGRLGYATWDPAKPNQAWVFHPITPQRKYHKYTHGIGFGDVNGDGRVDLLEGGGWWEQPAKAQPDQPWIEHPFPFAGGAAQMFAYDVDGDGLNDVITVAECHKYGLLWYRQVRNGTGEIAWKKNEILSPAPDVNSAALRISQLHAVELLDFNGDGLKDILTGKRFWAHGPKGDVEPNAPAVLYWFELQRDKEHGVRFVPHAIDDDSGVGTQVAATDLNGDGVPDVIVGNKKGSFVFLSSGTK